MRHDAAALAKWFALQLQTAELERPFPPQHPNLLHLRIFGAFKSSSVG